MKDLDLDSKRLLNNQQQLSFIKTSSSLKTTDTESVQRTQWDMASFHLYLHSHQDQFQNGLLMRLEIILLWPQALLLKSNTMKS